MGKSKLNNKFGSHKEYINIYKEVQKKYENLYNK